jgi:hypothetical protein
MGALGFTAVPLRLLTATGAKSGKVRTTPLAYPHDNGRDVVFAAAGGLSATEAGTTAWWQAPW